MEKWWYAAYGSGAPCRATNAEEFLNANGNIQRLLTPESVYMVRISKYNRGARSMNVAALRQAQLLSVSDNTDVEAEKRQIREKLAEYQKVTDLPMLNDALPLPLAPRHTAAGHRVNVGPEGLTAASFLNLSTLTVAVNTRDW